MSVTKQEIEITNRFFHAVEILKKQGKIKSLRQITLMYGLNYGNTYATKKNPELSRLRIDVISNLCLDFDISTEWMLFGIEPMFVSQNISKIRNTYRETNF